MSHRIKRRLKKRAKRIARFLFYKVVFPRHYRRLCRHLEVQKQAVFLQLRGDDLCNSFPLMMERASQAGFDCKVVLLRQYDMRYWRFIKNCYHALSAIASAKLVFLEDASNLISLIPLRSETKAIQLWHACGAFKKWGLSTGELKFGGSTEQILKYPYYAHLDLVTVSAEEVAWAYREAMNLKASPETVQAVGVSRTDRFFDPSFRKQARVEVDQRMPALQGREIILYAPTFRGRVAKAKAPDQLDIRLLRDTLRRHQLDQHYCLLIRHHPFVKKLPEIPTDCQGFAYYADPVLETDDLMCAAAMMITDYSSVMFEYSLFERPMMFFAYDIDDYLDWRGFYYPYDQLVPGPIIKDSSTLAEAIVKANQGFDPSEIKAFRKRYMGACDGQATERIWQALCSF
ncbi:MAG: CDP-glycerol glycerophosphotransferase family protein [Coriobacteriales bacterium]|jgi:CDP-ribitol ribitolphosphotransferase|nr:CDP-glycerol glycerophosphotransferase family protein [Coriobacteriales bacterium]